MGAKTATTRTATAKTAAKASPATKRVAPVAKKAAPAKQAAPVAKKAAPAAKKAATVKVAAVKAAPVKSAPIKAATPAAAAPVSRPPTRVLTESEILRAPEKDYMNAAQMAFFKARLQQLEKDLLKNAGETTEHLRETVLVPDPADRATIEEEHALELRTRDRERKLLKKVQQSIAAIDAGDYGWCEETGEPIGIPRLIARPTATLSLEAQQRRELKQKLYGD